MNTAMKIYTIIKATENCCIKYNFNHNIVFDGSARGGSVEL